MGTVGNRPVRVCQSERERREEYVATFVDDLLTLACKEMKLKLMELLRQRFEDVKYHGLMGYNIAYEEIT